MSFSQFAVSNIPMFVIGAVLVLTSVVAYVVLAFDSKRPSEEDKLKISLHRLSALWTREDVPVSEVMPNPDSKTPPMFSNRDVVDFYRNTLAPYVETALYSPRIGPALDAIVKILLILDADGDCPSVVEAQGDPEYDMYGSYYEILKKVTLREHSINVATEAMEVLKRSEYKEPDLMMGRILVIALAHDLGKIPKFMTGPSYFMGNHPAVSVAVVEPLLTEMPNREEILKAIRDHHHAGSTDTLVKILREADRRSREKEIHFASGRASAVMTNLDWMNPAELMSEMEKGINVESPDGSYEAFTSKDAIVFVQPAMISKAIVALAEKNGVILGEKPDLKLLSTMAVHGPLKGFLSEEVPERFAGRMCVVKMKDSAKERRMVLTPLRPEAFKAPYAELAERTKAMSKPVTDVRVMPLVSEKEKKEPAA